jgi:hypothetical protein
MGRGDFKNIVEVWFFLFLYWRTRLSSYLVTLRGLVLVLRFGELDKVT